MHSETIQSIALDQELKLSGAHPDELQALKSQLIKNIKHKLDDAQNSNDDIEVFDADWSRDHSEEAGQMHADIIIKAYGPTYSLPNKDPIANAEAISDGSLDVYLMKTNGVPTGTACLVDTKDGRAELGRAASLGRARNTVIQDLRLLNWLTDDTVAGCYHTLFTTLRNAPNRDVVVEDGGSFVMRGGQAVTEHWKKFSGLRLYGIAPLYLKAEKLEQFSYAAVARTALRDTAGIYLSSGEHLEFVEEWHRNYGLDAPALINPEHQTNEEAHYEVHYPPTSTGLTTFVHADIVRANGTQKTVEDCIDEAESVGSPFIQVEVPVETNTLTMQDELLSNGFKMYGYKPATDSEEASILLGRLRQGVEVVPTFWDDTGLPNPFWSSHLGRLATNISKGW